MPFKLLWLVPLLCAAGFLASGCGYVLQGSHSELLEREHIHRIYVRTLVNNTYKPGVQNVVYNALIRTLLAHRRVRLASRVEEADAVLEGSVSAADVGTAGSNSAGSLSPAGIGPSDGPAISTIYNATLTCSFTLTRVTDPSVVLASPSSLVVTGGKVARFIGPKTREEAERKPDARVRMPRTGTLWSSGFSRSKPFLSANQLDVPGTTSALINESEFDRALADLAVSMMDDLHESMLAMF